MPVDGDGTRERELGALAIAGRKGSDSAGWNDVGSPERATFHQKEKALNHRGRRARGLGRDSVR
jgi:hypothetical protein